MTVPAVAGTGTGRSNDDSAGPPVARNTPSVPGFRLAGVRPIMAGMRNRSFLLLAAPVLSAGLIGGCGLARQLTTQHRTYSYSVSLPPVPANTMAGSQVTL